MKQLRVLLLSPVWDASPSQGYHQQYMSLESLINANFGKKDKLPVFLIPQKKIGKMTTLHSINRVLIGDQN